jgi:hypothetical protein
MIAGKYTWFPSKDAIVTTACAGLCVFFVCACSDDERNTQQAAATAATHTPSSYSIDSVLDSLRGASNNVGPQAEALQTRTKEELGKLFRWEYRVVDLPGDLSAGDFEARLGELGLEGWEVISVLSKADQVRVSCKRRPPSALAYLKYVPGL